MKRHDRKETCMFLGALLHMGQNRKACGNVLPSACSNDLADGSLLQHGMVLTG
jgi:hypothetical protein